MAVGKVRVQRAGVSVSRPVGPVGLPHLRPSEDQGATGVGDSSLSPWHAGGLGFKPALPSWELGCLPFPTDGGAELQLLFRRPPQGI